MTSNATRLLYAAVFATAPLWGTGCLSSGASFVPASGVLSIVGTEGADAYVVGVAADGRIVVNGGAVPIQGGVPTLANTVRIEMQGLGGDDQLVLDSFAAALPKARLQGGAGKDVLIAGPGADELSGGPGDDELFGEGGDDVILWGPGDGLDVIEGDGGADTLRFTGSTAAEAIALAANGVRALLSRDVDAVTLDLAGVETVRVGALGGADAITLGDLGVTDVTAVQIDLVGVDGVADAQADTVTVTATAGDDAFGAVGGAAGVEVFGLHADVTVVGADPASDRLVLNAMAGADVVDATGLAADGMALVVSGNLGADVLLGGDGADRVQGGDGDDLVLLGPGDDTFTWNPGDDLDTVVGQEGFDTLDFRGANVAEILELTPVGSHVRLFRNIANVVLDLDDVEVVDWTALGGADRISIADMTGTDLVEVDVNLASASGAGDALLDTVFVTGTGDADVVAVSGDATGVTVQGLATGVHVTGGESAFDALFVGAGAGDDVVDATGLAADGLALTADGGADHDVLLGGDGVDVLFGDDGDDVLIGGPGVDALDGGPGDNILIQ